MQVRFLEHSRNGDWKKGDLATVTKTLASPPLNQNVIYVVRMDDGRAVWATDRDVEPYEQLVLF